MARKGKTNVKIGQYEYYQTTVTLGQDEKGRQIQKKFYGKTKTEAERKKRKYIEGLAKGLNPNLKNETLEKAMYDWLWIIEYKDLKASTFERYEGIYRNYVKNSDISYIK